MQTTDQYQSLLNQLRGSTSAVKKVQKRGSPSTRASNGWPNQAAIPFLISAVKGRASSAMFAATRREKTKSLPRGELGEEDERDRGPRGNRSAFRTVPVSLLVFEIVGGWVSGWFSSARCDAHGWRGWMLFAKRGWMTGGCQLDCDSSCYWK